MPVPSVDGSDKSPERETDGAEDVLSLCGVGQDIVAIGSYAYRTRQTPHDLTERKL